MAWCKCNVKETWEVHSWKLVAIYSVTPGIELFVCVLLCEVTSEVFNYFVI